MPVTVLGHVFARDVYSQAALLKCYSPPSVDRIWGIWGFYYIIPEALFYLPKGDYQPVQLTVLSLVIVKVIITITVEIILAIILIV